MDGNSGQVCPDELLDSFASGMANKLMRVNGLMLVNAVLMGVMVFFSVCAPRARRNPLVGILFLGASTLFLPIVSDVAAAIGSDANITGSLIDLQVVAATCQPVICIPCYKMFSKHVKFYSAKTSVAFGLNPRLIVAYMSKLRGSSLKEKKKLRGSQNIAAQINGEQTPELIVGGEELYYNLVEQPHGFSLQERKPRCDDNGDGDERKLVKLKRVWEQSDDTFLKREHKELCFSFALFKLLRCRFAKYTVSEAGFMEAQFFFRREYLSGKHHHDKVFQVIADELSFINTYYNSSLPLYCTGASVSTFYLASFICIAYCLYMFGFITLVLVRSEGNEQVSCLVWCPGKAAYKFGDAVGTGIDFGYTYFDVIPVVLVLFVFLISEAKDTIFYFCSNWTKVSIICRYLQHSTWSASQRCIISFVVNQCSSKLVNSWGDKMSQCSILVHRPWWKACPLLWRLFGFPEEKSSEVQSAVKESVVEALKKEDLTVEQEGAMKHIRPPSPPVTVPDTQNGSNAFLASGCKSVADTILAWHIATSIFELNDKEKSDSDRRKQEQPQQSGPRRSKENPPQATDSAKIVAIHLSSYCAYLVARRPELLPDEDDWCKKLYGDVLKGAGRVLRAAREAPFQRVIELLKQEPDDHMVLKNGAMLAEELVKDGSNIGWKDLADFWTEMVLYIAPSENLDGHAEAIARGGELVTLLWALLAHAGVVDRLEAEADDADNVALDALNASAQEAPDTSGDQIV